MGRMGTTAGLALGALVMLATWGARGARAQEGGPSAAPAPSAAAAAAPAKDDSSPDHDRFVGHAGVTYFDIAALPIANFIPDPGTSTNPQAPGPGQITASTVQAPVVGVRYWLSQKIGLDFGLGLGLAGGSQEAVGPNPNGGTQTITVDKVSTTGWALHAGVPIAFAHYRHYSFLAIPELTVGFTSGTYKPALPPNNPNAQVGPDQDLSGFLVDAGGRIGAEIHFGFMGVPELALQATVGLAYRRSVYKWKSGGNSASDGTSSFGTTVDSDPWAIFKDNISATYYF